jgi:hypothetical protein
MDVNRDALSECCWREISSSLQRLLSQMGPQGLSNTIYGLGLMRYSMSEELRSVLLMSVQALLPSLSSQGLSNVLYGMGALEINVDNIHPILLKLLVDQQLALGKQMTAVGWLGALHGWTNMGLKWSSLAEQGEELLRYVFAILMDKKFLSSRVVANLCYW